ncbi:MAG: VPLPA-CTERM sorting domain-containing protein [Defluviimonas denitrificans]
MAPRFWTGLGALMSNAFTLVTGSQSAAAFQMAAWEIANRSNGSLDLANGGFRITTPAAQGTQSLAQSWLDLIGSGQWTSTGNVTISPPRGRRTCGNIAPVPVPAAGVMLLGGLAGLGALRRRRKAA